MTILVSPSRLNCAIVAAFVLASSANAQRWEDYPAEAIRDRAEGMVEFQVDVDVRGRPKSCTIVKSAGHPALDKATCAAIMKNARWKPAKDDNGKPIEKRHQSRVEWRLPD